MCGICPPPDYPTRSETVEHPLLPRIVSSPPTHPTRLNDNVGSRPMREIPRQIEQTEADSRQTLD